MNDDPFETRLQGLHRRDLAAEWKAGILAAASPAPATQKPFLTPPRWLGWSLAAAWTLVLALHFLTPSTRLEGGLAVHAPGPGSALQQRQELFASLVSTTLPSTP